MDSNVLFAFGLTIFAGLATGIGSAIAFFAKKNKYKILVSGPWFLSWGGNDLCLFGGDICQSQCSSPSRAWYKTWLLGNDTFIFFGGIAVIAIIDKFVPSFENPPHETPSSEDLDNIQHNHVDKKKKLTC